jgi:natural product biosynthesis luciferase-like monooxygenase protein
MKIDIVSSNLEILFQNVGADLQAPTKGKSSMDSPSCFVVGNGVIPLSCLEILVKQGWKVLGIHSADRSLQEWANEYHIPHTEVRADFCEQLLNSEYDYLFSINNVQWIIPPEILARARRSTINYHDSPLPKYAGLNATSWALLNGESEHAVTWHEVTPEIDAGRIFNQKALAILADDTVFALNTRCFDAAVNSFAEMIVDLGHDRVKLQTQDLSQRSYFGASDRPAASAILSFDVSSQSIYNLVRALEFGPTRNQLGVPKLWLPNGVVAVAAARTIATDSEIPGQVLNITTDRLVVATSDGAIELSGFSTLEGQKITVGDSIAGYGVQLGAVLPVIDRATRDAITERNAAICRHEETWAKRLLQLAPFNHPYLPIEVADRGRNSSIHRDPICLSTPVAAESLMPIFAAYCAKLSPDAEFDLALQTNAQRSIAPEIFAQRVPLRVQTQAGESFSQFKRRLETEAQKTSRLGSFRHSLLRRYPELHEYAQYTALPVAIVLAASPDRLEWMHLRAALAFVAYADGSPAEVVHGGMISAADSHAIVQQLQSLISACQADPEQPLDRLPLLSSAETQQILVDWNQTERDFPNHLCIHELFEQQVERTPDAIAVAVGGAELTYRELNQRANQLAYYLRLQGVAPDVLVGLHVERSINMMVGLLGIHKAGGAYVPLDPDFPADRIALMLDDAQAPVIVTQQSLVSNLAVKHDVEIVSIDTQWDEIAAQPQTNPVSGVQPDHLSYVLYTSGSTGKPKGVMVEHRNVVNFFTGMDEVIECDPPGVWLAVTSLSFDISVLELCWTLARGFKVVIYNAKAERAESAAPKLELKNSSKTIDFSLFYFSSSEEGEAAAGKYRLLFEGAKFGDEQGFKAVWTPERHFHAFGGLFPNPAVTSAAIAATTNQIQIRAGSCVAPLHSSVRIAEDWSVVDNFSNGRVGIAFAAGWQPNDFVLRPENFEHRKEILFEQVEQVRSLWRGESVSYPNGKGENIAVKILPRPIQAELPVWITAAGNPETFEMAGAKGFNILTHLLGQTLEELAAKIAVYRQAWAKHGHPGQGTVTLMIHSFVGESNEAVKEIVRQPMRNYLASSLDLIKQAAWSFPTFKQKTTSDGGQFSVTHLSEQELDELLDFSFERYFETSGIFGTIETCLEMVDRIKGIDVNELACLIDYGVDTQVVLDRLPLLNEVKIRANQQAEPVKAEDNSIAALIQHHQVTHLQCTPSMASLLVADPTTRTAMSQIRSMMVGGEAFTEALASQLRQTISGKIHNMYGPTETTIWSATHTLADIDGVVPLGRPIANTQLYILDRDRQPVPVGMAGELLIGGQGVTRGYLYRPELTQERFVPDPFSTDPTARLYRTGDLVRYQRDGNLEFLGRIDFQVKVRGYRIELGEIETVLSRHSAIGEVVTIVREDSPGDRRIVAYILPQPGQQPNSQDLRSYLLSLLPEYMVPSHFVLLTEFPLTPNKKVDRKALPAPLVAVPAVAARSSDTPLAQTEQTLIEIWQEVLQIPTVGVEENFFDLGGNSLIAVTLIGKIRSVLKVQLSLINLFRSPTIADLAQEIATLNS